MIVNNTIDKPRLHWVDAAKGILIILVAMVHVISRGKELGISCRAIDAIGTISGAFCYRMPAFFILAGFWGKYDMSFKDFLRRNAERLILPMLVFSYLSGVLHEVCYEILKGSYNVNALEWPTVYISIDYWFVLALFLAKCAYFGVCRIGLKPIAKLLVCIGIFVIGVLTLKAWFLPNFACWKWALIMLVYLPLGQMVRENLGNWKLFVVALLMFLIGYFIYSWQGMRIPAPAGGMKSINLKSAMPSLVLCTAGSFVFLKLCSFIKRARVLELLGRNTLAIYIMHSWIEVLAMKTMRSFFSQGVWVSTLATIVTIIVAVFIPCMISELLNRPKLKWILGK